MGLLADNSAADPLSRIWELFVPTLGPVEWLERYVVKPKAPSLTGPVESYADRVFDLRGPAADYGVDGPADLAAALLIYLRGWVRVTAGGVDGGKVWRGDPGLEVADDPGITALHLAAQDARPATLAAMCEHGSPPINQGAVDGSTPLHLAAGFHPDPEVIGVLVAAGARPNVRDRARETPLHQAAKRNRPTEIAQALLAAGASPRARDRQGRTPYDLVPITGRELAELLRVA